MSKRKKKPNPKKQHKKVDAPLYLRKAGPMKDRKKEKSRKKCRDKIDE